MLIIMFHGSRRWNVGMPSLVKYSIKIISDAGLGMAMFSLGILSPNHHLHMYMHYMTNAHVDTCIASVRTSNKTFIINYHVALMHMDAS